MNVFGAAAANAIHEVRIVIARSFAGRSRDAFIGQPRLVRVVSISREVTLGSVENVADRVCLRVLWSQRLLFVSSLLVGLVCRDRRIQPRSWNAAGPDRKSTRLNSSHVEIS